MSKNIERLQEKLEELEAGRPFEECAEGLEPDEVELLQFASSLRGFEPPARKEEAIAAQLEALIKVASQSRGNRPKLNDAPVLGSKSNGRYLPEKDGGMKIINNPKNRFGLVLAASIVMLAAVIAVVSTLALGFWWVGTARARTATLVDVSGEVMVSGARTSGEWQAVSSGSRMRAGQSLQVGPDSSASLVFYEGSRVALDAGSQVTLQQLKGNWFNALKVVLVQEAGSTKHSVIPLRGSSGEYIVITSAGIASVRGTKFGVETDEEGYARFSVDTGRVLVEQENFDVLLTAGQAVVAQLDEIALDAAYQFSLIGALSLMEDDPLTEDETWTVNGVTFIVNPDTRVTGTPDIGLHVFVEGRIVDGERIADRVLELTDELSESSFTGILESMGEPREEPGEELWIVGGREVIVNADTNLVGDPQEDEAVKVIFLVSPEGDWVALEIIALEEEEEEPESTPTATSTATVTGTVTETVTPTPTGTVTPTPMGMIVLATGPITITDNDQVLTINCNGNPVTVNGNSNTLTLLGTCSSLTVRGNNNRITLEFPTTVTNTGNENIISMPEAPISISTTSTPTATAGAPVGSSGPVLITNNDQSLTINCNGAAVTVNGNHNTITLLGTCSSLTVRGNGNIITLQSPTVVINTGNENIIK